MKTLARRTPCAGCGEEIILAACRGGRWRPFESALLPPAPTGVWAWRKGHGMEETDVVHGYRIHLCPDYHDRIGRLI